MMLGLDLTGVPKAIQEHLPVISKNILFDDVDRKGGNGYVFFGNNKVTGTGVAVKYYYWGGEAHLHAEPAQLSQINAANVLQILDAGEIDGEWAYFLTPTCANGDLDDHLEENTLGLLEGIEHARQVLIGLSHLHAEGFLHRDLKPANIYVSDERELVIGDFGSVKKLPDGCKTIPASQHSQLYRPPESFANTYGITGDLYQCGLILFQILGGKLSYAQKDYLDARQQKKLASLTGDADRSIFVNSCIERLICAGGIVKFSTLPPWVPESVRRIIKKATHKDSRMRFQSVAAFLAKLHEVTPTLLDWRVVDGVITLFGQKHYRIVSDGEFWIVEKKVNKNFRKDNSFAPGNIEDLIREIAAQF